MVNQPQAPVHRDPANPPRDQNYRDPNAPAPGAPHSTYPGGMASDPILALASEITTNMKGAPDRFRTQIENTPALKALMDESMNNQIGEIAQSIRRLVDAEIAKVTGGVVPGKAAAADERERMGRRDPSA